MRQRKFGFRPKLPGRKRPASGDFSDLRSEARHTPRRPLSLPCGRGVGDPSPQAPPRQARRISSFSQFKVLLDFFQKIAGSRGSEATEVWIPDQTSGAQAPFFGGLLGPGGPKRGIRRDAPSVCLTGEGSATPPRRPHPDKLGGFLLFLNLKFYSIFFKKSRGRGAVRQRKFGFQTKLPGRKRPSSGVFSDLVVRSAAYAATPPQFALRARGR